MAFPLDVDPVVPAGRLVRCSRAATWSRSRAGYSCAGPSWDVLGRQVACARPLRAGRADARDAAQPEEGARVNGRRYRLIMWKEFLQFRRDPLLLRLVFIMPILQLLLFGYVVGADVTNLPTAVVDHDHTAVSAARRGLLGQRILHGRRRARRRERAAAAHRQRAGRRSAIVIPRPARRTRSSAGTTVPLGHRGRRRRLQDRLGGQRLRGPDHRRSSTAAAGLAERGRRRRPGIDARVRVVFNPSLRRSTR